MWICSRWTSVLTTHDENPVQELCDPTYSGEVGDGAVRHSSGKHTRQCLFMLGRGG